MDQIFKIKDAVVNYLSPVAKRRRTMGPQTPGCDRVEDEHQFLSEPRNNKRTLEFAHDRTNQTFITPDSMRTPCKNPLKRPREDDEVEGPIFSRDEISPKNSSSQNLTESGEESEVDPDLMDEDEEEDDDEISAEQKVNEYLAKQAAELAKAKETVERARAEGEWSPEEIFLLERLQYMGHEGLLPYWPKAYYLKTIPEAMWCDKDDRNAFLGDSAEAFKWFQFLNNYLGRRVHDRYHSGNGSPEHQMKIWIRKYVDYTEKEGGYHKKKFIPVLCLVQGRWKASAAETTKRLQDQMAFHAESWRRSLLRPSPILNALGETEIYFRRPPIIYGILYIQAKALFVTLDSSNPEAKIRDIHVCDFLDSSKHFWHAVSVAIVAKIAQKYMETFKDELEDDDPPESNSDSDNELESREKERQREEELLRLEQQMECIKVEEDADHVMESIEEYEKVDVIEGEEEVEEEEDDRPSESVYDEDEDEDEDVEVEVEEDEDMEQSQREVESGEETQYVEDDENEDEEDGGSNEDESENESRKVEPGIQRETERSPESTSSEEL
ncbi:hypothetical protein EYC84_000460 [Monilinia fructicola]|uniref:Uncharacterized protein n=1 Tax=Monilinia fructicola TaxID=38448 RepID=A0A5M9JPC6_MONFR|nr:hypothetical protein EYC84_000460 [Monilinia fructicola]